MTAGGEKAFLDWLLATDRPHEALVVPLGDDAAVWRLASGETLVVAADALAEGSHFTSRDDLALVGHKALAVNLSDLAAMGARPLFCLATCALPRGFAQEQARLITQGLRDSGYRFSCPCIGGDTITHEGGIVISVTVVGSLLRGGPITRSGAKPGDLIAVTGALGGSGRGHHLRFTPRLGESAQLLELGPPSAMIDVSDGLLLDLSRVATASGVGFRVDAGLVPVSEGAGREQALSEGEDFELLFTAPPAVMERVRASWQCAAPLTVIGRVTSEGKILVVDGLPQVAPETGYVHE